MIPDYIIDTATIGNAAANLNIDHQMDKKQILFG
jgi:hypothetical protein